MVDIHILLSAIDSSDDDSSSEGDEMPWQQIWLSSDSDLDYDALRKENNWLVLVLLVIFCNFVARVLYSVDVCFDLYSAVGKYRELLGQLNEMLGITRLTVTSCVGVF